MWVPRQYGLVDDSRHGLTRRRFLGSMGIAAGALLLPTGVWLPDAQARAIAAAGFGSGRALRAAMHVHGSWSEQDGSWEAQLFQAASNGYDLLYLTDHDSVATAFNHITSLSGIAWDPVVSTGRLARKAARVSEGSFHLLAESADALHTSNPVWLLRSTPPGDIPPARRAD